MGPDHRIDVFLSFHGSETLPAGFTTRELARATKDVLEAHAEEADAEPSIFFDETALQGKLVSILTAVLHTRPTGVAVFLLTPDFFKSAWRVTELRAFLHVAPDTNVKLRFVALLPKNSILNSHEVGRLEPTLFEKYILHDKNISQSTTVHKASGDIADIIHHAWSGESGIAETDLPVILGRKREDSFNFLFQKFFSAADVPYLRTGLEVPREIGNNIVEIVEFARRDGAIAFGEHNVSALESVVRRSNGLSKEKQRKAIKAYEEKWISSSCLDWTDAALQQLKEIHEKAKSSLEDSAHRYTVKSGDTLWKIAQAQLGSGSRYMEIVQINDCIKNPDLIYPGQELRMP